jgi:hypothetical protein
MPKCKYCKNELYIVSDKNLGYHPDCMKKIEKLWNVCRFCKKILSDKDIIDGIHKHCLAKENQEILKSSIEKSNDVFNLPAHTEAKENLIVQVVKTSQKLAKQGAIGAVMKSKEAYSGIKDIFKIADERLGKAIDITNEEEAYAWAASEIEKDEMVKGIWAMAFADAEGDEKKQKALYIKYRATKLLEDLYKKNLDD